MLVIFQEFEKFGFNCFTISERKMHFLAKIKTMFFRNFCTKNSKQLINYNRNDREMVTNNGNEQKIDIRI